MTPPAHPDAAVLWLQKSPSSVLSRPEKAAEVPVPTAEKKLQVASPSLKRKRAGDEDPREGENIARAPKKLAIVKRKLPKLLTAVRTEPVSATVLTSAAAPVLLWPAGKLSAEKRLTITQVPIKEVLQYLELCYDPAPVDVTMSAVNSYYPNRIRSLKDSDLKFAGQIPVGGRHCAVLITTRKEKGSIVQEPRLYEAGSKENRDHPRVVISGSSDKKYYLYHLVAAKKALEAKPNDSFSLETFIEIPGSKPSKNSLTILQ